MRQWYPRRGRLYLLLLAVVAPILSLVGDPKAGDGHFYFFRIKPQKKHRLVSVKQTLHLYYRQSIYHVQVLDNYAIQCLNVSFAVNVSSLLSLFCPK